MLGTSSATPTKYRHPSAHYVRLEGSYLLLDCGEGAQRQLSRYGLRTQRISHVFITHLHGDHYFGLPGLITSMALFGRTDPLVVVGPPALESIIKVLITESDSTLPYELQFVKTQFDTLETVAIGDNFEVISVRLKHRVPCTGFLVKEKGPERRLDVDACVKHQIPIEFYESLKWGEDYTSSVGKVIPNNQLTTEGHSNRTYAYITDTIFDPEYLLPIVQGADLLYHEATFLDNHQDLAVKTKHSTAKEAAQVAEEAKVGELILGHFSSRYSDLNEFIVQANTHFKNVSLAEDGKRFVF